MMDEVGSNWGWESSGHVLAPTIFPTGDGFYTDRRPLPCEKTNQDMESLQKKISLWPSQSGLSGREKNPHQRDHFVTTRSNRCNERIGDSGRILMRYSGTEPKSGC